VNLRAMLAAVVIGAVAAADRPIDDQVVEENRAAVLPLPPEHPWPGTPGPDRVALEDAVEAREERRRRLAAHRQRLERWQEQALRRLPCASATAAAYREQRLHTKRRSRALGHGA
jgi:hypothetical protein